MKTDFLLIIENPEKGQKAPSEFFQDTHKFQHRGKTELRTTCR